LGRHLACDIGAADLVQRLLMLLDTLLLLAGYLQLLADLNRPLGVYSSIPEVSGATVIPGNQELSQEERAHWAAAYFTHFHHRVTALLDGRTASGRPMMVIGVHSFTPVYLGLRRPWHSGVQYQRATALGATPIARLAAGDGVGSRR
jgi:predicted N-formylglutamate amidohydrolase